MIITADLLPASMRSALSRITHEQRVLASSRCANASRVSGPDPALLEQGRNYAGENNAIGRACVKTQNAWRKRCTAIDWRAQIPLKTSVEG